MSDSIVRLTRAQVREVDRRAIEDYHIPGIVLMENAAKNAWALAAAALNSAPQLKICVVCGGGNNGGDGLAMARHLYNRNCPTEVIMAIDPAKYHGDALINWRIINAMRLPVTMPEDAESRLKQLTNTLIIDAIFGTGLSAPPRQEQSRLIDLINASGLEILSVDLPSGLDCDSGLPLGACIRATRTVTFVAEKTGFANPVSRQYTGYVYVVGIGAPPEITAQVLRDLPA